MYAFTWYMVLLVILLSQLPQYWDYTQAPPCPILVASIVYLGFWSLNNMWY